MSNISNKLSQDVRSQSDWKALKAIFSGEFPKVLPENLQARNSLLMLHRIMKLGDDCMFLMKDDRYKSVYMIQRSIFEAYVELKLILKDEKHLEVMYKNHLNRLAEFYKDSDKALFDKYKKQGKRAKSVEQKCKILDSDLEFEKYYNSIYRLTSLETHPSLASLVSHIKKNGDGSITLDVMKEGNKQYLYFQSLSLLASAMNDVFSLLSCPLETINKIIEIGKDLQEKADSIDWKKSNE